MDLYDLYEDVSKKFNTNDSSLKRILDNGIIVCKGNPEHEILLTGMNPSGSKQVAKDYTFKDAKDGPYWRKYHKLFTGYIDKVAYLDLFPFKGSCQKDFEDVITKNVDFMVDVLRITQREIERIAPKLIIVANKRSSAYWGAMDKYRWMGYKFAEVKNPTDKEIDVRRIIGVQDDNNDNNDRILNLPSTNLNGSIIVFYGLYDDRHDDKFKLTTENIDELYKLAQTH